MTTALTPELALAYLAELSTDIRAAVVLDGAGVRLAGPAELADDAAALIDAAGEDAAAIEVRTAAGAAYGARAGGHAVVAVTGPRALGALVLHDLRAVLGDLEREPA